MVRVAFLVDGFNLYHSVLDAEKQIHQRLHWLDIAGMCSAQLSSIRQTVGRCEMGDVYYFSALAHHVESSRPGTVKRHQAYVWALESTGVHVELAQFKEKDRWCPLCHRSSKSHEEKETDVALAARLLELLVTKSCEAAVLVTGDTDVAPATRAANRIAPSIPVGVLFPFNRKNLELEAIAAFSVKLRPHHYVAHQLPNTVQSAGRSIDRPKSWG
jgi:uncharacterized LabA/DUF88 family protein